MTAKEQGLPELPQTPFCLRQHDETGRTTITDGPIDPILWQRWDKVSSLYTADQMRAYARAALASDTGERGALPESLVALARRCLHIAFVWNDHNFPAAHKMAREEATRWGIGSMDDANSWLDAPEEWPVPAALRAQPAGGGECPHEAWERMDCGPLHETRTCADCGEHLGKFALTQPQPMEGGGCNWQQQDRGGDWVSTGCGNEFILNDASQHKEGEQVFPHCPYCAKPATFHHWEATK